MHGWSIRAGRSSPSTASSQIVARFGRSWAPWGPSLRSAHDRELVRRAWEHWGEQCPDHLDGRFAFVVHDPAREAWFLARDRFAHRPLHYAFSDDRLCFASEVKTLLAVTAPPALDELALVEWSLYGDLLPPRTLFRGDSNAGARTSAQGRQGRRASSSECTTTRQTSVDPTRYAENAARSVPRAYGDVGDGDRAGGARAISTDTWPGRSRGSS